MAISLTFATIAEKIITLSRVFRLRVHCRAESGRDFKVRLLGKGNAGKGSAGNRNAGKRNAAKLETKIETITQEKFRKTR